MGVRRMEIPRARPAGGAMVRASTPRPMSQVPSLRTAHNTWHVTLPPWARRCACWLLSSWACVLPQPTRPGCSGARWHDSKLKLYTQSSIPSEEMGSGTMVDPDGYGLSPSEIIPAVARNLTITPLKPSLLYLPDILRARIAASRSFLVGHLLT